MLLSRYDDIQWDDSTIVVLNDVRISPPYTGENCTGSSSSAVGRIQKLVREREREGALPSSVTLQVPEGGTGERFLSLKTFY